MSCGKAHDMPCSEVLDLVYSYIDGEIDESARRKIRQHLDECGPCLREYGLEEAVKRLVQNHAGVDAVPAALRAKALSRIQQIRTAHQLAGPPPGPSTSPVPPWWHYEDGEPGEDHGRSTPTPSS